MKFPTRLKGIAPLLLAIGIFVMGVDQAGAVAAKADLPPPSRAAAPR